MLEQLQTWWQNTGPETQAYIQEGSWLIAGLVGGFIIGSIVARFLRARNFAETLEVQAPCCATTCRLSWNKAPG